MKIKHLPCGLFWHFDSGLEMRPALPDARDSITLGCRVDDGESDTVTLIYRIKKTDAWISLNGERQAHDKRYFKFKIPPIHKLCEVEYYFTASDVSAQIKSQDYSFSTTNKIAFNFQTVVTDDRNLLRLQCPIDTQTLELLFNKATGNFLINYLTDKVTVTSDKILFETLIKENVLYITEKCSKKTVAKISLAGEAVINADNSCAALSLSAELPGNSVYGGGEKFDNVNAQGKTLVCNVVEQYSNQKDKTYLPIPFFFTEQHAGILQTSTTRTDFSFEKHESTTVLKLRAFCGNQDELLNLHIISGEPKAQINKYVELTGKQALAPKWAFGPWMSSNGWNTQSEALEQISFMNKLKIPATVEVLEAWSDEETFYIWNDARYTPTEEGIFKYSDFTFPKDGKWPNPKEFTKQLSDNNVKLVLWQIPVVKYERAPHGAQLDLDEKYAIENRLCIQNADGTPYRITEMWFGNSLMPDFTNPDTKNWWFDKRRYLIEELGVAGFKTDGGEFLFDTSAVMHDNRTVAQVHNEYPNLYVGAYHEFMNEAAGEGNCITFSRAGYTGAQKFPIHWAGDQVSTWSELRGQLTAGLSLGLSGVPFWSFDIGGFAGDFPSTELYLRSALLAVFSPVMQFHSEPRNGQYYMTERERWNNDRSPWNIAAANKDDTVISVYRMLANLRMNLLPYIWDTAKGCVQAGRPMMAHLVYDYPQDMKAINIDDEYMFGTQMLVAPIIEEGALERSVYLPQGEWYSFTTGECYSQGLVTIKCGLQDIPVFVKAGSIIPVNINKGYVMGSTSEQGAISNKTDEYAQLSFFVYGTGEAHFKDELGNAISIKAMDNSIELIGTRKSSVLIIPVSQGDNLRLKVPPAQQTVSFFGKSLNGYIISE